jgi:hypothetical protein
MLCQYDKLSQVREELVGGAHPKKNKPKKMAREPLVSSRHISFSVF